MAAKKKTKKIREEKVEKSEILETMPKKAQDEKVNLDKTQLEKNNRILVIVFILIGLILLAFFAGHFFIESKKSFEYKGVKFNIIKEGELIFYNTQIPVYSNAGKEILKYNFYLRTDPRELGKMDFNEIIIPMKLMAINYSDDMSCSGYGTIALQNIINLYELIGTKVTIDRNATCDAEGRYMFLNFQKANKTSLEKIGNNCYNLNAKECDVFPSTERLMLDTFVKIKQDDIRAVSSAAGLNK